MKRLTKLTFAAALPALLFAGCDDFLTGPKLNQDPNRPTAADRNQLMVAIQASQFTQLTGHMSRVAAMWTQQMAGTDRQYQSLDRYDITEADFSPQFSGVYTGGGLIDLRRVQASAEADGDLIYAGIAKVWEALVMGTAASIWGDIPYSQAANDSVSVPVLDEQVAVYAMVQSVLDAAIADLMSGAGPGPGEVDLVFGGNPAPWIEVAHTLKARFYMHLAELDPANYGFALEQAIQGISTPANNLTTVHTANAAEQNMWHQFFRERDSYMRAGEFMVTLLQQRSDPRLPLYFAPNQQGTFDGAAPGEGVQATHSMLSAERVSPGFGQPVVTWEENQLILAEAALATGDEAFARQALNDVRQTAGLGPVGAGGQALLEAIMLEKYVALFQNLETWNDYKRTCLPALTPAAGRTEVPGRFLYGEDERNANPNIPPPSEQPLRNDNDPQPCG